MGMAPRSLHDSYVKYYLHKIEQLCLRMHSNTAFVNVQPFTRLLLHSASECRRRCVDLYPKCVAVMFYYLHERNENHVCYLFDKNSIDQDVALVEEKPMKELDVIRALEIVVDCHQFDPYPPLLTNFTTSTDQVSKKKRDVGYMRPVEATGSWSTWSECSPQSRRQVRSQPCEYGRNIQLRTCHSRNLQQTTLNFNDQRIETMFHQLSEISYPPHPYKHPSPTAEEYMRIMSLHKEQMARSCCYWLDYFRQQCLMVKIDQRAQSQCNEIMDSCPKPCPVPSVWSQWSQWTSCSTSCGVGSMQRYRTCVAGQCENDHIEWGVCDQNVLCVATWAEWSEWSSCHATCGKSKKSRSRYCPLGRGHCGDFDHEVADCELIPCPEWTEWESWSHCSVTCGKGTRQRSRICNAIDCIGEDYEESECQQEACSEWSGWLEWSPCSVSCGQGINTRERVCLGHNCLGQNIEQTICMEQACPTWQEWSDWSSCSATCDYGISTRTRSCDGSFCTGKRTEVMRCQDRTCPSWAQWSECSVTCGSGFQRRQQICPGGYCVGDSEETRYCETGISCVQWSTWTSWSTCSETCGLGERTRHRLCVNGNGLSDDCKGDKTESAKCLDQSCCQWTEWNNWTPCSHNCERGLSSRTRMCLRLGQRTDDLTCSDQCPGDGREDVKCNENVPCKTHINLASEIKPQVECISCKTPAHSFPTIKPSTDATSYESRTYPISSSKPACAETSTEQTITPLIYSPSQGRSDQIILPPQVLCSQVPRGVLDATTAVGCHWSEWNQWTTCLTICVRNVKRRFRSCIGTDTCSCHGSEFERADCMLPTACKSK
ncbi:unnamed protein product [Thelazia callipaeda]|uniref:Apple domain-containing protein n=1 Tax=Thelazia callipaeda TaxID=103827 RepID=A0A0N5CKQ6_THECL|nr:unnamed protein product [Thelazia callipaeda]